MCVTYRTCSNVAVNKFPKNTVKARIEPELSLLMQLLLYKLSVWDAGASYGAKLQDLRYVVTPPPHSSLTRMYHRLIAGIGD